MASVSFNNVAKVYPDGTRAVWELDLDVEDGKAVVLVGRPQVGERRNEPPALLCRTWHASKSNFVTARASPLRGGADYSVEGRAGSNVDESAAAAAQNIAGADDIRSASQHPGGRSPSKNRCPRGQPSLASREKN